MTESAAWAIFGIGIGFLAGSGFGFSIAAWYMHRRIMKLIRDDH